MRRIPDRGRQPPPLTRSDSQGRRIFREGGIIRRHPEKAAPRPAAEFLTNTAVERTHKIPLPHGCFNAGMAPDQDPAKFILAFRPDEYSFSICRVYRHSMQLAGPAVTMGITNCADPRLIWLPNGKLLVVYSSYNDDRQTPMECMRGGLVIDPDVHPTQFITPIEPFRISPPTPARQKNWMPFVHEGELYFVANVKPHIIYKWLGPDQEAVQVYENDWVSPWFLPEFKRGNTNIVQLDDGNYLGTFHTVQRSGEMHHYDNGCYLFEGKPPFKVLRCSRRCYLPAEAAIEPHFRKKFRITVCFPVGMIRDGEKLLISFGDNDSAVKIAETTVAKMLATTLPVY